MADVYRTMARALASAGGPGAEEARQAVTEAFNVAYDTLLAGRLGADLLGLGRHAGRRSPRFRRLAALLAAASPLAEAAAALLRAHRRLPEEVPSTIAALAEAVDGRAAPPSLEALSRLELPPPGLARLVTASRSATGLLTEPAVAAAPAVRPPPLGDRVAGVWDRITARTSWLFAGRLAICVGLAAAVTQIAPLQRSYWVPLTAAIVLKPDFGSVFARGVQRALGP